MSVSSKPTTHTHAYVYHRYTCVCTHTYIYTCTCTYTHTHIYMHALVLYTHADTHIHRHTCMHVHAYTHTCRGQGETKERVSHSRLVDSRFNKPGNLPGLSWVTGRQVDLHLTPQNLKSLYRGLNRVQSRILSKWSQQHMTLSRLHHWKWLPPWDWWAEHNIPRTGKGVWTLWLPSRVKSLWLPSRVVSFDSLLQQC